jgi:hypothetical protein
MHIAVSRRVGLGLLVSSLVGTAVAVGSAPVGATPVQGSASTSAAIVDATLNAVSVAPNSTAAWAFGGQSTTKRTTEYALRRVGSSWKKEPLKVPAGTVQLFSIAAGSAKSAWIVGNSYKNSTTVETLIEHSTGGGFKPYKTGLGVGQLLAASASSASNVWAIGDGRTNPGPYIVHWNGHAWKALNEAKLVGYSFSLVSASSPTNVWFLGNGPSGEVTGVWNGHTLVTTPFVPPAGDSFVSMATTSAHSTWLAGNVTETSGALRVIVDHWNGKKWTIVKVPQPAFHSNATAVAAAGSKVYVLGTASSKSYASEAVYVLRYSGGHWAKARTASPGKITELGSISASTKYAAAVGYWSVRGQCGVKHPTPNLPLVDSLSGSSFKQVTVPKMRAATARLRSVPAVPSC